MNSPFKFLDAYTASDKDIFFGRGREVEQLYNMVYKTPLVMVYGLSGTGKTSLVQCGLATRFDGPDWLPFLIRKEDNINRSVRRTLQAALDQPIATEDLNVLVERLFYNFFRPVYLLFDQFEELVILGTPEEQQKFMQDIKRLQAAELPCRVVLILREEYIGQLYEFEKILPTLFDYKLRVEPMTNKYIESVITHSFEAFNIELEPPEKKRCEQLMKKLNKDKTGISLPYLQVYLDMLYREDYQRTYPKGTDEALPPLTFTEKEIDAFGEIDDVLDRFLSEKSEEIQNALTKDNMDLSDNLVKQVLDIFVSDEGTKLPMPYERIGSLIAIKSKSRERLSGLSDEILSDCLSKLEEARVLRFLGDTIELAHDMLAALIDQQRTDQQRRLNKMRREIRSSYSVFKQTKDYLSLGQLELYRPVLKDLDLNEANQNFVEASEEFHTQAALEKVKELEEERSLRDQAQRNEKKATDRTNIAWSVTIMAVLFAVAAIYFFQNAKAQKIVAEQQTEAANEQKKLAQEQTKLAQQRSEELDIERRRAIANQELAEKNEEEANEEKDRTKTALQTVQKQKRIVDQQTEELSRANQQAEERRMLAEREADEVKAQQAILENLNREKERLNKELREEILENDLALSQSKLRIKVLMDSIQILKNEIDSIPPR